MSTSPSKVASKSTGPVAVNVAVYAHVIVIVTRSIAHIRLQRAEHRRSLLTGK
jgi:hypothetical protein